MSTLTTPLGLRYPDGNEKVKDGRLAIEHLAEDVDARLPSFVTALPTTPYDGQEIHLLADDANGVIWTFRYRAASTSAYKWEFVGGPPLMNEIDTDEQDAATGFVDLATVGPQITVPLAGDYAIHVGAGLRQVASGVFGADVAVKFGAAATAVADGVTFQASPPGATNAPAAGKAHVARAMRRTITASGTVLKVQYRVNPDSTAMSFRDRFLTAVPFRVG